MIRNSDKYGLDPELVTAVVIVESNARPWVVSRKGAVGLMQLMAPTAKDMGCKNRRDPEENLKAGIKYMELPVAFDALTVVINPQNTWAKTLTVAERRFRASNIVCRACFFLSRLPGGSAEQICACCGASYPSLLRR